MPLVTRDSQADWQTWYDNGQGVTYGRSFYDLTSPDSQPVKEFGWLTALGITPADRVLVAGCGYGYLMEVAHANGHPYWGGIDNSAHVTANRGIEATGSTLWIEDDFRGMSGLGGASRNLQRDLGVPGNQRSSTWDWIVTEFLVECYEDAELTAPLNQQGILEACEWALEGTDLSQIVHLVLDESQFPWNQRPYVDWTDPYTGFHPAIPYVGPTFNSKSLSEWKAMRPAHTWMHGHKGTVVV